MDPRQQHQPHPFSRPQYSSQQHYIFHPSQHPPIPPPPYSSQPTVLKQEALLQADPFLPRQQRYDVHGGPTSTTETLNGYNIQRALQYPPKPFTPSHNPHVEQSQPRRGSYGTNVAYMNGRMEEHHTKERNDEGSSYPRFHPLPPPPPPPPSANLAYHTSNHSRPPSMNGGNSAALYGASVARASPPPPPYAGRQMLPPTSPSFAQNQYLVHPSVSRIHPPPTTFARDLSAYTSTQRPGSSMSISSMLGNDGDKPSQPISLSRGKAYTPRSGISTPTRANHPIPQSPQNHPAHEVAKQVVSPPESFNSTRNEYTSTHQVYPNESPRRPLSGPPVGSADSQRFGPSIREPNKQIDARHQSSNTGSNQQPAQQDLLERRPSLGRIDTLTSSQHFGYRTPPTEAEIDARARTEQGTSARIWRNPDDHRRVEAATHITDSTLNDRHPPSAASGAVFENRFPNDQRLFPSRDPHESRHDEPNGLRTTNYPFLTRHSNPPTVDRSNHIEANSAIDRTPEPPSESPYRSSGALEAFRRLRDARHPGTGVLHYEMKQSPRRVTSYPLDLIETRQAHDASQIESLMEAQHRSHSIDQSNDVTSETHEQPRSSLNLLLDSNKKYGRISPLPQAVQGAQGQMRGPASEPGIKNEFARMFSGIGSGVGSGMPTSIPMESGASISFPSSPTRLEEHARRTPFTSRGELVELMKPRNSSRGGRKGRKVKDEEPKGDTVLVGGLDAKSGGVRGSKKSRNNQTHHHHVHHHHTHHVPHHHHHHHHIDAPSPSTYGFPTTSTSRRIHTPNQASITNAPSAQHHHHHLVHLHHPHHHHPPAKPIRKPNITIDNSAVLENVHDLPRHHLGSTLYAPLLRTPSTLSEEHTKFGYVSTPKPLPRFDGKANCTFTVRVPRYYLQNSQREEICRTRALWGSEVYTDDSDPIAAAIHSGWIRGEWAEDVDISMLDLSQTEGKAVKPAQDKQITETSTTFVSQPETPMTSLAQKDLHITLLILPTLQAYASLVCHGLKSRAWTTKHDGMSFKIEKISWVDEGVSRGEERGGEARRKRLRALMKPQALIQGPAVKFNTTGWKSGGSRAIAASA